MPALATPRTTPSQSGRYRVVRRALHSVRHPREAALRRRVRRGFESSFLRDRHVLRTYEDEIRRSGILEHMRESRREYDEAIGGLETSRCTPGGIGLGERIYLYAILRTLKPRVAVETGVANGFSTAFALLALEENGGGALHSIDLPREAGREYAAGTFYEGMGSVGIPPERMPGWLVPDELRKRWTLHLGRSQEELPPLLEDLGTIEFFLHDSEHSFECMWFEFAAAWAALREGGVLVSDDVNSTTAFSDFARQEQRQPIAIGRGTAFLVR